MTDNQPQMCYAEKHTTQFALRDLDTLKGMLSNADPDKVKTVADNWKWINDRLVGGESGGLKKEFDDAVEEVLEHWSGAAAEAFRKRAQKISTNISNAAPYAQNVENAMRGAEGALRAYKDQLDAIQKPSGTDSAMDAVGNYTLKVVSFGSAGGRDDSKANAEIAAGKPTQDVLSGNSGELSEGKERQLQGAIVMEYLGAAYRSNARVMGTPPWGRNENERDDIPGPDGTPPITPVVPLPTSVTKPKQMAPGTVPTAKGPGYKSPDLVNSPRPDGIHGGVGSEPRHGSQIGTGLNGVSGGTSGLGTGGLGTGGLGGGALGGGVGAGTGGIGAGSGTAGMPGGMAGAMGGGPGGAAGTAGARSGRAGMPGMGGGAGAGAGGAKGAAGRGGGLARQRGGVVGAAKGAGVGSQGGSGLHRSRGGTQAGKPGTGRGMGMAGAPGARGAGGEEKDRGQRPDYLVEDEETWTTERNVAPRVIE